MAIIGPASEKPQARALSKGFIGAVMPPVDVERIVIVFLIECKTAKVENRFPFTGGDHLVTVHSAKFVAARYNAETCPSRRRANQHQKDRGCFTRALQSKGRCVTKGQHETCAQ